MHHQEKLYRAFLNSNAAEETLATGKKVLSALTVSDVAFIDFYHRVYAGISMNGPVNDHKVNVWVHM